MTIGARLRRLREEKKLSQEDLGERTGLVPCYISRVENGHTVPSLENLERLAAALEVPLYALFYEGNEPSTPPRLDIDWSELQTTEERFFGRKREKQQPQRRLPEPSRHERQAWKNESPICPTRPWPFGADPRC